MADDRTYGHVLDADGVTPVLFTRDGDRWSNAEPVHLPPGAWLNFGSLTISNGQSIRVVSYYVTGESGREK